jgi:hypothetical protein
VHLPNEAPEETEVAQGRVRNRFESPPPANTKRPIRTCLAESLQMAARTTNQGGDTTGSCSSLVENDADHDEEDPEPPMVTDSGVQRGYDPGYEVVQKEATTDAIPADWTRAKPEPSSANRKRPSGQMMATRTNQREHGTDSRCSSVEKDAGRDGEDSKPLLVTFSVLRIAGSDPDQKVVQEEATTNEIPAGWTRAKLDPDWWLSTLQASRRTSSTYFASQPPKRRRTKEVVRTRNAVTVVLCCTK